MADTRFAYVRFHGHPEVSDSLNKSAAQLQHCMDNADEANNLQIEKHAKIAEAKQKVTEILEELEKLNSAMLREQYVEATRTRMPRSVIYEESNPPSLRRRAPEDKDTLVRSEKALQNLQKNLEILKRQLG